MPDSSERQIKEYTYWTVHLHANQSYLGRCVVWCNREGAHDLATITGEEQKELFLILGVLRSTSKRLFQPDWFNYAFQGNVLRHLHGHFVPRYKSKRVFEGVEFLDERWGKNYIPAPELPEDRELNKKIILAIRNIISE